MYDNLRLKALVKKINMNIDFNYEEKVLAYISLFEREPEEYHKYIKAHMAEFVPDVWNDFKAEDLREEMENTIKNYEGTQKETQKEPDYKKLNYLLKKIQGEL